DYYCQSYDDYIF
nr:immunoglobulin light chain junction region [Macaca mulatta]MOX11897.1 immunoglobulin light chain junction region [Macaca mulatta]MOX12063.1 immunoglobulin light chain junction region [Macaca mulatta]MOX12288.1 immunoglobulin light chain junction region [Macaca mulatta]MOX12370.1 immunoglobulin light chain junction region [Macaca mulatta]